MHRSRLVRKITEQPIFALVDAFIIKLRPMLLAKEIYITASLALCHPLWVELKVEVGFMIVLLQIVISNVWAQSQ